MSRDCPYQGPPIRNYRDKNANNQQVRIEEAAQKTRTDEEDTDLPLLPGRRDSSTSLRRLQRPEDPPRTRRPRRSHSPAPPHRHFGPLSASRPPGRYASPLHRLPPIRLRRLSNARRLFGVPWKFGGCNLNRIECEKQKRRLIRRRFLVRGFLNFATLACGNGATNGLDT